MTAQYPSASNVYVRSHEASNKLTIDFARDVTKFPINQYAQIVPVKKLAGYYLAMTVEEAGRILNTDGREFIWPDGQPAPEGNEGTESHEYKPYECMRRAPSFNLGDLTVDQADWNILAKHAAIKAQQAMTLRTQLAITALTTAGNWASSHRIAVSGIGSYGDTWGVSTVAHSTIRRSLIAATEVILDDTLAAVTADDLVLVVNSALAGQIAVAPEIVHHITHSPLAWAQVQGEMPNRNKLYGLPERLFGMKLVIEDTRKVTSKKGATKVVAPVLATATPFIVARPGSLEGVANAPNFSTATILAYEEMGVETWKDINNKRTVGRVIETLDVRVSAPASGVLFSAAS